MLAAMPGLTSGYASSQHRRFLKAEAEQAKRAKASLKRSSDQEITKTPTLAVKGFSFSPAAENFQPSLRTNQTNAT